MKTDLVTQEPSDIPIGNSGFYFSHQYIGDSRIDNIYHISGNLYEIVVIRIENEIDDHCAVSKEYIDHYVLDLDDKKIYSGYTQKINEYLYAIFDVQKPWVGRDRVIIKNIVTKDKIPIKFPIPSDEKIVFDSCCFEFPGSMQDESCRNDTKRWNIFINNDGKIIYKGFCWEHSFFEKNIIIRKFKSSTETIKVPLVA